MRVRCRFGWHDWAKWEDRKIQWMWAGKPTYVGRADVRNCDSCGRSQSRKTA